MKPNSVFSFLLFVVLLSVPLAVQAKELAKDNYKTFCMQCHGMQGTGMGLNIRNMSVQPRDHSDTKAMSARSDAELFKVIKEGGFAISKSVLMPPWGDTFTDDEINDLVIYLRDLCKCKYGG